MASLSDGLAEWGAAAVVGQTEGGVDNACFRALPCNLISGKMEHTCTTCSPYMAIISKPNKKHSKWAFAKQRKKRLAAVVLLHVCTTLDRFVWGSAEACILRAGGGKHFITAIRRLSEPCDSECTTCLPFTHRCRLSQSGEFSGAALAALAANEVWGEGTACIRTNIWSQFALRISGMRLLSTSEKLE